MQKHKTDITTRRLALLIDCDNISANCAEEIFDKAKQHGQITIKRAYGDWNSAYTKGWVEMCRKFALRPVHQFGVPGKNSTDMALIIDAMDILYMYAHHNVDAVCICSSDRDYVPLVIRIKESGLFVIGFLIKEISSKETVNAYDEVIYISNQKAKPGSSDIHKSIDEKTKKVIKEVYKESLEASDNPEGVPLGLLGSKLKNKGIDYKEYRFNQLNKFLSASQLFDDIKVAGTQTRAVLK